MLKLTLLVVLIGYVCGQSPMGFLPPGCDLVSLQQCMTPLMNSAMMTRQADMSLGSPAAPDLDTGCRMLTGLKTCVMPKLQKCGREILAVANAAFKAVDYMCGEGRSETEKFTTCFKESGNPQLISPCINQMVQAQMSIQASIRANPSGVNLHTIMGQFCGILSNYEQCAERTAGSVCPGADVYLTKLFKIFNSGLSFMNCTQFGAGRMPEGVTSWPARNTDLFLDQSGSKMEFPNMSPLIKEMQCVMKRVQTCVQPIMALAVTGGMPNADQICRSFERSESCHSNQVPVECATKARSALNFMSETYDYLCVQNRAAFRSSLGCVSRKMMTIVYKCVGPMQSMAMNGEFLPQNGQFSDQIKRKMCRIEKQYDTCIGLDIGRHCGYSARDLVQGILPSYSRMLEDMMGMSCYPDGPDDSPLISGGLRPSRHHHHRKILMIVLPIAGIVVLAIIVVVAIAIKRRQGANRGQDKAELVKSDLLQQNLRLAIADPPREKSLEGGLRV